MSAEPEAFRERRRAWRVLRAMERELRRQNGDGLVGSLSPLDENGRLDVSGRVDLAAMAEVAAFALKQEFGL